MKQCLICGAEGKYKCPTCILNYCSSKCFKAHQDAQCVKPVVPPVEVVSQEDGIRNDDCRTEDMVPLEKLKLLEHDKKLNELLANPHLRDFIIQVDKTHNPELTMQKAMMEPIFVEFVDACLSVVEENNLGKH